MLLPNSRWSPFSRPSPGNPASESTVGWTFDLPSGTSSVGVQLRLEAEDDCVQRLIQIDGPGGDGAGGGGGGGGPGGSGGTNGPTGESYDANF